MSKRKQLSEFSDGAALKAEQSSSSDSEDSDSDSGGKKQQKKKKAPVAAAAAAPAPGDSDEEGDIFDRLEASGGVLNEDGSMVAGAKKLKKKKKYVKADETVRVFVGRLPKTASEADIRAHFDECGTILSVMNKFGHVPETGKYKGVAIVEFAAPEEAQAAIQKHGSEMQGQQLNVKPSTRMRKTKTAIGSRSIFVGNLPWDTQKEELAEVFAHCGKILSVRIATDKDDDDKPKGYAFVVFEGIVKMKQALSMNGRKFKGRKLKVGDHKGEKYARKLQAKGIVVPKRSGRGGAGGRGGGGRGGRGGRGGGRGGKGGKGRGRSWEEEEPEAYGGAETKEVFTGEVKFAGQGHSKRIKL